MALVKFNELKDAAVKKQIEELTHHYPDKEKFFVDKLSQGVATIAAAFYPKDVIVRMSDFKTNEYANLIGGKDFEPLEENPMIGFRGASRYYNELYREGFRLECEAIRKVRDEMGLTNVKVMIPFCRTIEEGNKVIAVMKRYGLEQGVNNLEVYVMDRDSAIISDLFSEQNEAAKEMIATMIHKAKAAGEKIGLCGQAPSDFADYAQFLVEQGIDSISFNPDALLKGIENINKAESRRRITA
jgi:pyruvate,water dikinase